MIWCFFLQDTADGVEAARGEDSQEGMVGGGVGVAMKVGGRLWVKNEGGDEGARLFRSH